MSIAACPDDPKKPGYFLKQFIIACKLEERACPVLFKIVRQLEQPNEMSRKGPTNEPQHPTPPF